MRKTTTQPSSADQTVLAPPGPLGAAALARAQAYARQSAAPATLRAYRADWAHYAAGAVLPQPTGHLYDALH